MSMNPPTRDVYTAVFLLLFTGCGSDPLTGPGPQDLSVREASAGDLARGPCEDGVMGGKETDVDCGGEECRACDLGRGCRQDTDCKSGRCLRQICWKRGSPVSFSPEIVTSLSKEALVYQMAIADFDGDRKLDVVTPEVAFLGGNGDGTFRKAVLQVEKEWYLARSVAAGDFNGDGTVDFVATTPDRPDEYKEKVAVFYNRSRAGFTPPDYHIAGGRTLGLHVADLNRDGRLDMVVRTRTFADPQFLTIVVLLRLPGGGFGPPTALPPLPGLDLWIVIADVDRDGKLDLAVARWEGGGGLVIFRGRGDGTFETFRTVAGPSLASLQAADLEGDGMVDLIGGGEQAVWIFRGAPQGMYGAPEAVKLDAANMFSVLVADFDGDEVPDLLCRTLVLQPQGYVLVPGDGNGGFLKSRLLWDQRRPEPHGGYAQVADMNGDGRLDIVGSSSNLLWVVLNL